ncbi:MAG: lamin tail domain-containing protein [Ignavibacteria bacterium]|nr:lamin tail domain-containing protein [Ignavibacteria bacterium]
MNQSFTSNIVKKIVSKYSVLLLFTLLTTANLSGQVNPRVFINEVLASNLSTNPDMVDFGDFSDWIELYNDENIDVNIGGFYLSDDFTIPTKWQFPANTIIPAKSFYLVWADDYNNIPGNTYLRNWWPNNISFTTKWCHTNFKLNKGGDKLGLFNANGSVIDSLTFPNQSIDISFGRQPDAGNTLNFFGEPTPLASNTTTGLNTISLSGEVNFSIEGGFYQNPFQLTLTSKTGSGIIRYTTDGSKPSSKSTQYLSPISINANTIVRARLFEDAKMPGKTITNSYFVSETRNLPVVSLVTDQTFLWDRQLGIYVNSYKEREIPVSLEYFPLNSERAFSLDAGARIGGENIFRFAQKPFNIYARSDYGSSHIDYKIFDDLPYQQFKELYLRNSGSDWTSTMFRDGMFVTVLKHQILNAMQGYKPAVLYLNGTYWGIQNLREKIIDDYFLKHYNVDPLDLDHLEDNNKIISGDSTDFMSLIGFVNTNDLTDPANYAYVTSRVDIHDLMDFVIVQDYIANPSWGHNRETWRDRKIQNLWRWVLVDMDRGFDVNRIGVNQLSDINTNFEIFRKLSANPNFKNEFVQRYSEHLNKTFSNDRVVAIIDSIKSLLQNEMPRHIQKWGTLIDSLSIDGGFGKHAGVTSMTYWDSEVLKFKTYSTQRPAYAIQHLNNMFGLTGRANLKITSNILNEGKAEVNGYSENLGENNLFFKNIPLQIKAYPPPGYDFKQWKEKVLSTKMNLIPQSSFWRYSDASSTPTGLWASADYNDASWKLGTAQFGYGDGDEKTVISYGPNSQSKYITSYYRRAFQINDLAAVKELTLKLMRDDGAVVYLNGNEILRSNMSTGTVSFSSLAPIAVSGTEESTFFEFTIDKTYLLAGTNILAVEIHQSGATSSDVSFDLSLDAVLNQQSTNENVVGTADSITYAITDDTELIAEFEKISSSELAQVINEPITLSKANSPYFVLNDVTVGTNGIVTVEPGTIIYFSSGKSITVNGQIIMNGTETEPITLTSYYPSEKWGAICFENSVGISELKNVNISLATNGIDPINFFAAISSLNSTVHLKNVNFDNVKLPISTQWSNVIVDGCKFENVTEVGDYINCNGGNLSIVNSTFIGNAIPDMDGIDLGFVNGTTDIRNNIFRDFTGSNSDGIDLGDASLNVSISDNYITNCSDKGISVGQGSTTNVVRNIISNCNLGIGVKDSLSSANVLNTTFYSNNIGVSCFEKAVNRGGGSASIINSIFANSKNVSASADNFSFLNINYSLSNSDTLIGEYNIYGEPLLINPDGGNYHIQANSLCINNGDPSSPLDSDGSISDIGVFMYAGEIKSVTPLNEINYNSAITFDSGDWIEIYNTTKVEIDISGWVFMDENRIPSFVFPSGTILQPDAYLAICSDITLFSSKFPNVKNVLGNMTSGLSGSGEALFLYNTDGQLVDSLTYNDKAPWPIAADGGGSSLELANPTMENALGENWRASIGHGTPGSINSTYVTGIKQNNDGEIPKDFSLSQNYPNPFNPETKIEFELPQNSFVSIKIFDILGNEISTLVNGEKSAGRYAIIFNSLANNSSAQGNRPLSSGIYFYQLNAMSSDGIKNFSEIKKMVLLK